MKPYMVEKIDKIMYKRTKIKEFENQFEGGFHFIIFIRLNKLQIMNEHYQIHFEVGLHTNILPAYNVYC